MKHNNVKFRKKKNNCKKKNILEANKKYEEKIDEINKLNQDKYEENIKKLNEEYNLKLNEFSSKIKEIINVGDKSRKDFQIQIKEKDNDENDEMDENNNINNDNSIEEEKTKKNNNKQIQKYHKY